MTTAASVQYKWQS